MIPGMFFMRSFIRVFILLLFSAALGPACARRPDVVPKDSPLASELKLLERQVGSLKKAIAEAREENLFPLDHIAVGIGEEAVQAALSQALPLEQPVAQDFRARIDKATVSFRSMQGSVNLEGRIWAVAEPGTYADLLLIGGIQNVEVERKTGVLEARIVLDGWDVKRAAAMGAESALIRALVRLLGERGLTALRDLVPQVRIPVGIEDGLDLPEVSGPLAIPAGRLPFDATVSRVLPLSGRLWVMIQVRTEGWRSASAPGLKP